MRTTTADISFEQLEDSVPSLSCARLCSLARCAAQLADDVDQLHGDELVALLELAVTIPCHASVV